MQPVQAMLALIFPNMRWMSKWYEASNDLFYRSRSYYILHNFHLTFFYFFYLSIFCYNNKYMLEQACENVSRVKNDFRLNIAKIAQNICSGKIHYSFLVIQTSAFSQLQFVSFTGKKKKSKSGNNCRDFLHSKLVGKRLKCETFQILVYIAKISPEHVPLSAMLKFY